MLGFRIFKRLQAKLVARENFRTVRSRISRNQAAVLEAVGTFKRPCTGRMVATYMGWDSASVTNRLAELRRQGKIQVAYRKRGLDGMWRNYYEVVK